MRSFAILSALIFPLLTLAGANSAAQNSQPLSDAEWAQAKCRFRVMIQEGAFGSHKVSTLAGCLNSAEYGLMALGNSESDEWRFHQPTEVQFTDDKGTRHVCILKAVKAKFDHLPAIDPNLVNQPGYYDRIPVELKSLLKENFTFTCSSTMPLR